MFKDMKRWLLLSLFFFPACSFKKDSIKIKGSDTEVNLAVKLAEAFYEAHPEALVSISGGGSGLGIASLLNGNADIANSSRSLKTEELELFEKKQVKIDSFIFAQDAIAFVVADQLPLDSIDALGLGKLLSGAWDNWSALIPQLDLPVNIYGRQSNSGTYDFVKQKLNIEYTPHAKQMNGNAQILEAIKVDNSGIGYVGAGYVSNGLNNGLKVLKVSAKKGAPAISPLDEAMIAQSKYYFQRPLFQFFKQEDIGRVKSFLDFEKTTTGQGIIKASGYYPSN